MPRIGKEDVTKRENLLKEAFRKNPKLKMEEAQKLLQDAGGPRMRPQRIYDLRKEVKAEASKSAEGTTQSASRKGTKVTARKAAKTASKKTSTTKKAPAKKTGAKKGAAKKASTSKAPAKRAARAAAPAVAPASTPATTTAPAGVANREGTVAPASQADLLLVNVRHGDRAVLDKVVGALKRGGIDVEVETLKG